MKKDKQIWVVVVKTNYGIGELLYEYDLEYQAKRCAKRFKTTYMTAEEYDNKPVNMFTKEDLFNNKPVFISEEHRIICKKLVKEPEIDLEDIHKRIQEIENLNNYHPKVK